MRRDGHHAGQRQADRLHQLLPWMEKINSRDLPSRAWFLYQWQNLLVWLMREKNWAWYSGCQQYQIRCVWTLKSEPEIDTCIKRTNPGSKVWEWLCECKLCTQWVLEFMIKLLGVFWLGQGNTNWGVQKSNTQCWYANWKRGNKKKSPGKRAKSGTNNSL